MASSADAFLLVVQGRNTTCAISSTALNRHLRGCVKEFQPDSWLSPDPWASNDLGNIVGGDMRKCWLRDEKDANSILERIRSEKTRELGLIHIYKNTGEKLLLHACTCADYMGPDHLSHGSHSYDKTGLGEEKELEFGQHPAPQPVPEAVPQSLQQQQPPPFQQQHPPLAESSTRLDEATKTKDIGQFGGYSVVDGTKTKDIEDFGGYSVVDGTGSKS